MRATRIALPLAVLSLGLAACGGDDNSSSDNGKYPSQVEDNFLKACNATSHDKTEACKCALTKLEETLPYDDFKKADEAIRKGGSADPATQKTITAAIKACA